MSRGSAPSLAAQPSTDFMAMQKLVQRCFQSSRVTLQSVEEIPGHLLRLRLLVLSDGSRLVLKLSPSPSQGVMRHERQSLDNEATVSELLQSDTRIRVPRIIKWDGRGKVLGSPFLLTTSTYGTSLRDQLPYMTKPERDGTDVQIGRLIAAISQHASLTFGSIAAVQSGRGSSSWRQAFRFLVESVLRDAEDFVVSLPYPEIREQVERFGPILDDVTEARLVVFNGWDPANVLLDPQTREVVGFLDFGNTVWGDVLMSDSMADPSKAFSDGFGGCPERTGAERIRQLL
ncbi:hypothetical protein MMC16_003277 [Acarospora aff. strigata]|nr:hypothetical protein [Acarospora aff. strigata]